MDASSEFGAILRRWRGLHGWSQLELSLAAGVSSRHISFIETGRARPSRAMVLRLAETLELPLRQQNALLVAAGFAPAFRESRLESPDLAPVRRALDLVLRSHEPFPAFVLDCAWNILLANESHYRFLALLLPSGVLLSEPVNAVGLVLDPALMRPSVANWELVAHVLGHRLSRQLRTPGVTPDLRRQLEALIGFPGVAEAMATAQPPPDASVVVPLELTMNGQRLSWFSTIATIGTPQDVTLDELRIESLFPADEGTDRLARDLAAASRPPG